MIDFGTAVEFPAAPFADRWGTYGKFCLSQVKNSGMWLEFGVATGVTAAEIIKSIPAEEKLYGFDWFNGLPEKWEISPHNVKPKGELFGSVPGLIPRLPGLKVVNGLFADTLPGFFDDKGEQPVAFVHVDCDLYESTKTIFKYVGSRLVPGTIIMFDEIYGYPNYHLHEYRAWSEFVEESGLGFEWLAFCGESTAGPGHQAACRVI